MGDKPLYANKYNLTNLELYVDNYNYLMVMLGICFFSFPKAISQHEYNNSNLINIKPDEI